MDGFELFSETLIAHRKTEFLCWQSAARPYFRDFYVTYRYAVSLLETESVEGWQFLNYSRNSPHLYKPAIPLAYSQDAVSGPNIWPRDSSPHPSRLLQICFSIISSTSRSSKWYRSLWFPHQIVYTFVVCLMHARCSSHLVLGFISLIVFDEDYKPQSLSCIFHRLPALFVSPAPISSAESCPLILCL